MYACKVAVGLEHKIIFDPPMVLCIQMIDSGPKKAEDVIRQENCPKHCDVDRANS